MYDVSNFSVDHPGGRVLLSSLGVPDSTDVFTAFHPGKTFEQLDRFYIGDFDARSAKATKKTFDEEYRALGAELRSKGLFKAKCGPAAQSRGVASVALS